MNYYIKKVRIIALIAFIVACLSLGIGYSSLNTTLEINGEANVVKDIWDVRVENVHDIKISDVNAVITTQPNLVDGKVNFGVNLKQPLSEVSFYIDIINRGNVDAIVRNINLSGIEGFESYVTYEIEGINVNDKIVAGDSIKNVKVIVKYKDISQDQLLTIQEINLSNLNMNISFKEV